MTRLDVRSNILEMNQKITTPRKRGRPAKEAGDFRETREALLNAGVAALTEKGFSATGIDEVLKSIGVPKGSFYNFFGNKEVFGSELIARYDAYFIKKLDRFFLDESRPGLERIHAFFVDAERGMKRFAFRRGCLIGNLGQEMGALPESFRSQLTDVLLGWQRRTATVLEQAKAAGEIDASIDCVEWAAYLWTGWEGAVLRAKLERSATPLRMFAKIFLDSIQR